MRTDTSLPHRNYRKLRQTNAICVNTQESTLERARHSLFSNRSTAVALLTLLLWQLRLPSARADSEGLEQQLRFDYVYKVLTLRHFYSGKHLRFHPDGTLNGDAPVGPWTIDGQVAVKDVRLRDRLLDIKARRINLLFDSKPKPQDQLTTIDNYHGKDRDELEKTLREREVEIEIELPSDSLDQKVISSAIHAVFLAEGEPMLDLVPAFWHNYFANLEGKMAANPTDASNYRPGSGMSPPHATFSPDPEYPEEARRVKSQGTVVVSLVADASGTTRDIQITKPRGLGFDENAVATVSTWKFEPAQKDGKPISVILNVEVTFRLY